MVLVGMMGSGKSTIGRLLAQRTGWPYHDNDTLLERHSGHTPRQLLESRGETALRAGESEALGLGLSRPEPCIIAAAAGTIVEAAIRQSLAGALVVWLRAGPQTLAARAAGAEHRPWLEGEAEAWMRATLAERGPLYESIADHSVDTDGRAPADVAADILAWLRRQQACGGWLP